MKNMVLFADANVILEILLPGRPKVAEVERFLSGKTVYISMLTVHLAYHFGKKENYGVEDIKHSLEGYEVLDLTGEDYQLASHLIQTNDFEDALQLAVALRSDCDCLVTLDRAFARTYKDKMTFIVPE